MKFFYIWCRYVYGLILRCENLDPFKFDMEMDKKIMDFHNCQYFAGHIPLSVRLRKIMICVKISKASWKFSHGNYTSVKNGNISKIQLITLIMKSFLTFRKFSRIFLGIVQTSSVRLRWTLVCMRNLKMYGKVQHKFLFFVKSEIQYKLNFADISIFDTCVITVT